MTRVNPAPNQIVAEKDPAQALPVSKIRIEERGRWMGPASHLATETERLASLQFDTLMVKPLGVTLGAEVSGLQCNGELSGKIVAEIRAALCAYKVLVFRNQPITSGEHIAFAKHFGELEIHPFIPSNTEHPELVRFEKSAELGGYENEWHHDVTWRERPSLGAILHAIEVPEVGGDTLFCDMHAVYEGLDPEVRSRIDPLMAVHDYMRAFGHNVPPERAAEMRAEYPEVVHPVVRTHPETGQRSVFVNRIFTREIQGMSESESRELIEELCSETNYPEYQVRIRWERDTLVFWANHVADIRPFTLVHEGLNPNARYTYPMFRSSLAENAIFDREHDDLWADLFAPPQSLPPLYEAFISSRQLIIFNEDMSEAPNDLIRVDWRTVILGTTRDSGFFTVNVSPGEHVEASIDMPVPRVLGDTPFQLVLNATRGGVLVFEDRLPFLARELGVLTDPVPSVAFDDFSVGSANDLWSFYDSGWARTGVLEANGTTKQQSVGALDYYTFEEVSLEFDVRVTNGTGWAGMSFRRSRPEDYQHDSGYSVFLRPNGVVSLYDADEGGVIASAASGNPGGLMKTVRVETSTNRIQVWVDDVAMIDHTDTTNPFTTPGYVGFIKNSPSIAEYDNVRIVPEPYHGLTFGLAALLLLGRSRRRSPEFFAWERIDG